jgi:SAM-dependent methyltransferase
MNINTKDYWEKRFATGDWEAKMGSQQTTLFAKTLVRYLKMPTGFSGKIIDFGCGLGDAMPIYREHYSCASLIGVDITQAAIAKCKERYGDIAQFIQCDYTQVPDADVIISCAVFEHLSNQMEVARHLFTKCTDLYIIVPYKEVLNPCTEHVNSYDENCFSELGEYDYTVFLSQGWSEFGLRLWLNVYLKNLMRPFFGRKAVRRKKMIMFHIKGEMSHSCGGCQ